MFRLRWFYYEKKEKLEWAIASLIPKRIKYLCMMLLGAEIISDKFPKDDISKIRFMDIAGKV